jgi:16S rRNA (cytosine967-C5)-methyltransferase
VAERPARRRPDRGVNAARSANGRSRDDRSERSSRRRDGANAADSGVQRARPGARKTPRGIALAALLRINEGAYAHLALPEELRRTSFSTRDRGFVTELVYGTLREQRSLDRALRKHCRRELEELDLDVLVALRLGAYQLAHGVSPHAAVGETVSLVPEKVRGVVNAVLRSLQDGGVPDPNEPRYVRGSYPRWIVEDLDAAYGEEDVTATLAMMNTPPFSTLRVHPTRATPESVAAEVEAAGGTVERGSLLPDTLTVRGAGDLMLLDAVADGRASVQDQASQAVVRIIDAQPGERVLDVAAAPGGKASALAELMSDRGVVAAGDLHSGRVRTIVRGAQRLGLQSIAPYVGDGRHLPFVDGGFDRVLLDAPCSGLGVLRRRPDARHRVTRELIAQVAELQRHLLVEAARVTRPGGLLIYSVCTLSRAETVGIDWFANSELAEFEALDPPEAPWRRAGRGAILLPHVAGTDGMFVLRLRRREA